MQGVTEETITVATTADTLELQYLKSNSPTRNVNISFFKTQSNHSFVYNTKKNSTIKPFFCLQHKKKFHVLSKIAYVIMCIYILVQQNTVLAIFSFFQIIAGALASPPFPSCM